MAVAGVDPHYLEIGNKCCGLGADPTHENDQLFYIAK